MPDEFYIYLGVYVLIAMQKSGGIFFLLLKLLKLLKLVDPIQFQTTNYGLGGLCEKHMDPHGYIEGRYEFFALM